MNYEYDENNRIKDTDPLYETLDQWHENDECSELDAVNTLIVRFYLSAGKPFQ